MIGQQETTGAARVLRELPPDEQTRARTLIHEQRQAEQQKSLDLLEKADLLDDPEVRRANLRVVYFEAASQVRSHWILLDWARVAEVLTTDDADATRRLLGYLRVAADRF